jgi:hypothetical protein
MFKFSYNLILTQGPKRYNTEYTAYVYFLSFLVVGCIFLMNLFLGIIIYNFSKARKKQQKSHHYLSDWQNNWIKLLMLIEEATPRFSYKMYHRTRLTRFLGKIVDKGYFSMAVYIITGLCLLLIMIEKDLPSELVRLGEYLNIVCLVMNLFELILKLIVSSPRIFISDGWNLFDLIIIGLTSFEAIKLFINLEPRINNLFSLLSAARIFRFLRLLAKQSGVRKLLRTVLFSFPKILNIYAILMLVLYVYAMIGFKWFSNGADTSSDVTNFQNFFNSMMNLQKVATADNWSEIMMEICGIHGKASLSLLLIFENILKKIDFFK